MPCFCLKKKFPENTHKNNLPLGKTKKDYFWYPLLNIHLCHFDDEMVKVEEVHPARLIDNPWYVEESMKMENQVLQR